MQSSDNSQQRHPAAAMNSTPAPSAATFGWPANHRDMGCSHCSSWGSERPVFCWQQQCAVTRVNQLRLADGLQQPAAANVDWLVDDGQCSAVLCQAAAFAGAALAGVSLGCGSVRPQLASAAAERSHAIEESQHRMLRQVVGAFSCQQQLWRSPLWLQSVLQSNTTMDNRLSCVSGLFTGSCGPWLHDCFVVSIPAAARCSCGSHPQCTQYAAPANTAVIAVHDLSTDSFLLLVAF
jgi:hypothetical protein